MKLHLLQFLFIVLLRKNANNKLKINHRKQLTSSIYTILVYLLLVMEHTCTYVDISMTQMFCFFSTININLILAPPSVSIQQFNSIRLLCRFRYDNRFFLVNELGSFRSLQQCQQTHRERAHTIQWKRTLIGPSCFWTFKQSHVCLWSLLWTDWQWLEFTIYKEWEELLCFPGILIEGLEAVTNRIVRKKIQRLINKLNRVIGKFSTRIVVEEEMKKSAKRIFRVNVGERLVKRKAWFSWDGWPCKCFRRIGDLRLISRQSYVLFAY